MKKVSIPAYTVLVLISIICCILLVGSFSLSANSAYAADDDVPADAVISLIDGETVTYYDSFSAAIGNVKDGVTLRYLQDGEMNTFSLNGSNGVDFTIDLNGKTVDFKPGITEIKTLTFRDDSAENTGTLVLDPNAATQFYADERLTFENITVKSGAILLEDVPITNVNGGRIESIVIVSKYSRLNMTDGYIKNLRVDNQSSVSGGTIELFEVQTTNSILSGGTIRSFLLSSGATFKSILCSGYAYQSESGELLKPSEMTKSTAVNIVKCAHESFTVTDGEYVCDYCEFVCPHTTYDGDECTVCKRVCPHDGADETNRYCADCHGTVKVKVTNDSGTKFYVDFDFATGQLIDGDYMTILADIELDYRKNNKIHKNVTLDLNGCKLTKIYLGISSAVTIVDHTDKNSSLYFSTLSGADITVYGNPNTRLIIMTPVYNNVKIYGGIIAGFQGDAARPSVFIPDGYVYRYFDGTESRFITKDAADKLSFIGNSNEYLAVEKCKHPVINSDLTCNYCGTSLGDALVEINEELETAKNNLQTAIDEKADINTLNEKVKELNDAIAKAEAAAKKHADDQDTALKTELNGNIESAVSAASTAAKTALETAQNNLQNQIDNKADTSYVDEAVKSLTTAIENAETAKKYADQKDAELKENLENQIATAKGNLETLITQAKNDAINSAKSDLEQAKNNLQAAIDEKADISTLNEKVKELNEAIAKAETAKAYADQKDTELKEDLENQIKTAKGNLESMITEAKNAAVNSANSALDSAKTELNTKIATKADANEVNEAIERLTAAIANAETANNAYTDSNNAAVKAELTQNIADSKAEINAAIEALSKRLKEVEDKTDTLNDRLSATENKSNTLQTVLIVFIVLLSLANVATVVTFSLRKRK